MNTGLAVCGRRTLIEAELLAALVLLERLRKRVVVAPELQHLFLEGRAVVATGYFFKGQNFFSKQKRPGRKTPGAMYSHHGTTRFRDSLTAIAS